MAREAHARIDADLWRRLRVIAVRDGLTGREVLERIIRTWLERREV